MLRKLEPHELKVGTQVVFLTKGYVTGKARGFHGVQQPRVIPLAAPCFITKVGDKRVTLRVESEKGTFYKVVLKENLRVKS